MLPQIDVSHLLPRLLSAPWRWLPLLLPQSPGAADGAGAVAFIITSAASASAMPAAMTTADAIVTRRVHDPVRLSPAHRQYLRLLIESRFAQTRAPAAATSGRGFVFCRQCEYRAAPFKALTESRDFQARVARMEEASARGRLLLRIGTGYWQRVPAARFVAEPWLPALADVAICWRRHTRCR